MRRLLSLTAVLCAACGEAFVERPTRVIDDPASADFWAKPLPSDSRVQEDGSFDLERWPNARDSDLVTMWFQAANKRLRGGWGVSSGVFVQLSGAIDEASLPATPELAMFAGASAFL